MIFEMRDTRCAIVDNVLSWRGRRSVFQVGERFAVNEKQFDILGIAPSEFQENVFNATLKDVS